jgi:hypothetical protein
MPELHAATLAKVQREARDAATRSAAELADEPGDLEGALGAELAELWNDLSQARRDAINHVWSMQCDNIVNRIAQLTALVGPCPWRSVGLDLLEGGIWQAVHEGLGVAVEPPDMEEIARIRAEIERTHRG